MNSCAAISQNSSHSKIPTELYDTRHIAELIQVILHIASFWMLGGSWTCKIRPYPWSINGSNTEPDADVPAYAVHAMGKTVYCSGIHIKYVNMLASCRLIERVRVYSLSVSLSTNCKWGWLFEMWRRKLIKNRLSICGIEYNMQFAC